MNAPVKESILEFAREELSGKLLALCVGQMEKLKTPWNMTSEKNQEIALNKMREVIDGAVRNAVLVIATERRPALRATVDSVTFKDEIKATLSLSKAMEGRHDLADAAGTTVLIIIARPEEYTTGAEKVTAKPDQNALPLGESVPEIRKEEDETWSIYNDGMPMPGGTRFETQQQAEAWLQKHLGIEPKKRDKDTSAGAGADDTAEQTPPPPPPNLDDVIAAFKEAGKKAGEKNDDMDVAMAVIKLQYPADFVEENLTELERAFADGFEEGSA